MSDEKKRKPIMHIIHERNHTHTQRVGSFASTHYSDPQIVSSLSGYYPGIQYTNLNPGIYIIDINGDTYAFDLYETISGTDYLEIDSSIKAVLRIGTSVSYVALYRLLDEHSYSNSYNISDTINNWFDMLVVDGYSAYSGTSTPNLDNPTTLIGLSQLVFESSGNDGRSETLTMDLKTILKSLPNEVKDICIINSQFQKFHIISRVGRTTFSGYESWAELTDWCDNTWCYYYCENNNVVLDGTSNNLRCTHLPCYTYSNIKNASDNCVCICNDSNIGNGFIMKVKSSLFHYGDKGYDNLYFFQKWLNDIFLSGNPMVVEYPLSSIEYKTILLSEYHISTYFNNTTLKLTNIDTCNVSYFYKTL